MIQIVLADGTVLTDITLNGTTFVSKTPINESIFDHNLSPVDIEQVGDESFLMFGAGIIGHHENMKYQTIISPIEGEFWFGLNDIPESEMRIAKMASDIEYVAMMNDIEL